MCCQSVQRALRESNKACHDMEIYRDVYHSRGNVNVCCVLIVHMIKCVCLLLIWKSICVFLFDMSQQFGLDDDIWNLLTHTNRSQVLKDMHDIFPDDLTVQLDSKKGIKLWKNGKKKYPPICIHAPDFMKAAWSPFLKQHSDDTNYQITNETDSHLDDTFSLTKLYNSKNYVNDPAILPEQVNNMRFIDFFNNIAGYEIDRHCLIRIERKPVRKWNHFKDGGVPTHEIPYHLCAQRAQFMKPSWIVLTDDGIWYQIENQWFCAVIPNWLQNYTNYKINKATWDNEILSLTNPVVSESFDFINWYLWWFCIGVVLVIIFWHGILASYYYVWMIFEVLTSSVILWFLMQVYCFVRWYGDDTKTVSIPTFEQIWNLNILLCVPDYTYIRLFYGNPFDVMYRIALRCVICLILLCYV